MSRPLARRSLRPGKRLHDTDFARFDRLCHLWGWGLFVASALCFVTASVRAGDPVGLAGSLLFLVACFLFLAPFAHRRHPGRRAAREEDDAG